MICKAKDNEHIHLYNLWIKLPNILKMPDYIVLLPFNVSQVKINTFLKVAMSHVTNFNGLIKSNCPQQL